MVVVTMVIMVMMMRRRSAAAIWMAGEGRNVCPCGSSGGEIGRRSLMDIAATWMASKEAAATAIAAGRGTDQRRVGRQSVANDYPIWGSHFERGIGNTSSAKAR
jgi:hypothetical protein